jgi:hypothetical protein
MAEPAEATRFLELAAEGANRRFLLAIPANRVLALREARLRELRLPPEPAEGAADPALVALRGRIAASALADACRLAGEEAANAVIRRLGLRMIGAMQTETLAAPPGGELVLRVTVATMPELAAPDPGSLVLQRLVVAPDPEEPARVLAALAESRSDWRPRGADSPAEAGDAVLCDVTAELLPPPDRLPPPQWRPGALPEGWSFGDNNAGLTLAVLESEPGRLRLRLTGSPANGGQSYILFHPNLAIPAAPGSTWSGSVGMRVLAPPVGMRSGKLRLDSRNAAGQATLRRKDAAATIAVTPAPVRIFVSDTLADPGTAWVRLALLLDHQGGPLDLVFEVTAPRLVEGLDLGQVDPLPLPEFSGTGQRIAIGGAPDPANPVTHLAPHLAGIRPGETRRLAINLPRDLPDRSLADHPAGFTVRAAQVLRRVTPAVDEALAQALGFADLDALRAFAAQRVATRNAELERRQLRRALIEALLAASPAGPPLPEAAVQAELATLWPRLAEHGTPPPREVALAMAERRLRAELLLDAVAREAKLEPSEADLAAAAGPGAPPPAETLRARALREAAIRHLLARARIEERPATLAELTAAAAEF